MDAIGVRSSWDTLATKADLRPASRRSRPMARKLTRPAAAVKSAIKSSPPRKNQRLERTLDT
jgi:hypothetical protein